MTVQVPVKDARVLNIVAWQQGTPEGIQYVLRLGDEYVTLSPADADKLGRYLLFDEEPGSPRAVIVGDIVTTEEPTG